MPTRGKRTKTPNDVPTPGDPDRKRVLNVLAQRRYRQRRRERISALEAQARNLGSPESPDQSHDGGLQLEAETMHNQALPQFSGVPVERTVQLPTDADLSVMSLTGDLVDFALFPYFRTYGSIGEMSADPAPPSPGFLSHLDSHVSPTPREFPLTPDGSALSIPILNAVKAFGTIATSLNLVSKLFDPLYLHILPTTLDPSLPPNFNPTKAQLSIPHHPMLDALPWPSVREKLICILSLPSALRPPIARDENGDGQGKAIMQLMQDLDDFSDGIVVHGNTASWGNGNELAEESWEIGEVFFRNWWWCLDGKIVEVSNQKRRERGVRALKYEN